MYTIHLPPLRERGDDLELLVRHFLQRFGRELDKHVTDISPEAMRLLRDYPWPGNIRELQSVVKHILLEATGPVIVPAFVPAFLRNKRAADSGSDRAERRPRAADTPAAGVRLDERLLRSRVGRGARTVCRGVAIHGWQSFARRPPAGHQPHDAQGEALGSGFSSSGMPTWTKVERFDWASIGVNGGQLSPSRSSRRDLGRFQLEPEDVEIGSHVAFIGGASERQHADVEREAEDDLGRCAAVALCDALAARDERVRRGSPSAVRSPDT